MHAADRTLDDNVCVVERFLLHRHVEGHDDGRVRRKLRTAMGRARIDHLGSRDGRRRVLDKGRHNVERNVFLSRQWHAVQTVDARGDHDCHVLARFERHKGIESRVKNDLEILIEGDVG